MEKPPENSVAIVSPGSLIGAFETSITAQKNVNLPCSVTAHNQKPIEGLIADISVAGLQLEGNTHFVKILYPNFKRNDWRTPIQASVDFSVPTSKKISESVSIICQLIFCRRTDTDTFRIGCMYVEISQSAQAIVEDFLHLFEGLKK